MRLYERAFENFSNPSESSAFHPLSSFFFRFYSSSARFSSNKPDLQAPCSTLERNRRVIDLRTWQEDGLFIILQIYVIVGKLDTRDT